jgi:hypothetical protein
MDLNTSTATALLTALLMAREHGSAESALRAIGMELDTDRFDGIATEFGRLMAGKTTGESLGEALAVGILAGRVLRPGGRMPERVGPEPSTFVMDHDLNVVGAEGESILALPWFDAGLFVGRQLPDIGEMPQPVRALCVEHYQAALGGERARFAFSSYGLAFGVEAVPVRGDDGRVVAVLAIATPACSALPRQRISRG